jgi:hypothetical protein
MAIETSKQKLLQTLEKNPALLRKTLLENPALLDYLFSDSRISRKYVKVPAEIEEGLKKVANQTGVAEGILLGLGAMLLLVVLSGETSKT